jgi:hypothetical protein
VMHVYYVRWRKGEPRRCRDFERVNDSAAGDFCFLCADLMYNRPATLVAVGPDGDEGKEKFEDGRWFTCAAVAAHTECVDQCNDDELADYVGDIVLRVEEVNEGADG